MCGIWALFGFADEDARKYCLECMKISHRGPDSTRIETVREIPNACLGFHRLVITDQTHGMQPLRVRAHPHIWVLYNGEIYNSFSLRDFYEFNFETECDGEIIIHLYERFGAEKTADMLNGVFGFIILDTKQRQVHLGRDIFGVRPLFTFYKDGTVRCMRLLAERLPRVRAAEFGRRRGRTEVERWLASLVTRRKFSSSNS